jgi:hypothetical protein
MLGKSCPPSGIHRNVLFLRVSTQTIFPKPYLRIGEYNTDAKATTE